MARRPQSSIPAFKRKRKGRGFFGWLIRIVIGLILFSVLWVLAYRFVPPPVTATMLGDLFAGRGINKDWMSLDEMDRDMVRAAIAAEDGKFCQHHGFDWDAIQDAAKGDLATSGLQIDSFTIQAIRDESGYMELIGQQETARRERDARMAKAAADQEAAVREAEAEQIKINAARDVALRRAEGAEIRRGRAGLDLSRRGRDGGLRAAARGSSRRKAAGRGDSAYQPGGKDRGPGEVGGRGDA